MHAHTQSEHAVSEGELCDDPVQSYEEATKLRLPLGSSLPVHLHTSLYFLCSMIYGCSEQQLRFTVTVAIMSMYW